MVGLPQIQTQDIFVREEKLMTTTRACILILIIAAHLFPRTVFGLEALSKGQMKHAVAQAGIDIAICDKTFENHTESLTISNPDDTAQYISFQGIRTMTQLATGSDDMNDDGMIHHLSIDIGSLNTMAMFMVESPDLSIRTDLTIAGIDFAGTDIGSLSVESMILSSFHLYMGPHAGSTGVDYEFGQRLTIADLSFNYNTTDALTFSGITFSNTFGGTLEDPATWSAVGEFQVGAVLNGSPATLDIAADTQASWTMTDSNGVTYSVENPRCDTGYIALNMPMSGSIRVENMNFGGNDLGLLAIDGINVQKLYIEIPGRGLGKP